LPLEPAPFARQDFTEDLITRRTAESHQQVLQRWKAVKNGPQFTPPSKEGTIVFPGFDGGGEWGGPAWDPESGILYVNSNEMAWILRLVPRKASVSTAKGLYMQHCSGCHRPDLRGTPPEFPSLVDIGTRRTPEQMLDLTRKGAGRMPGFAHLGDSALKVLMRFLTSGDDVHIAEDATRRSILPFGIDGYNKFLDSDGYPAVAPPWGTLNAINLHTGKYAWKIPFGEFPELAAKGMRNTGTENYGGPIVTAGELLFIGATNYDRKFRAYDKSDGKLLWETELPAAGNATPAMFELKGKQIIVIAAGGGKSKLSGGSYLAYALP
jgi:quinoprotein glucose dehydrogenase